MSKHTPGPWVAPYFDLVKSEKGEHIAGLNRGMGDSECAANARLIAAAPDMLAALEMVHDAMVDGRDMSNAVLAAITKAKGPGAYRIVRK